MRARLEAAGRGLGRPGFCGGDRSNSQFGEAHTSGNFWSYAPQTAAHEARVAEVVFGEWGGYSLFECRQRTANCGDRAIETAEFLDRPAGKWSSVGSVSGMAGRRFRGRKRTNSLSAR